MLISRKPYCKNCKNRGSAYGPSDYVWYLCSKGKEIDDVRPGIMHKCDGLYMTGENWRCPDKRFFDPIYTKEQQLKHNNHK